MESNGKIILKNGKLFNGIDGEVSANGFIEIRDGKISYIGDEISDCDQENTIDCEGKFIMPGIIDCHVHLCGILGSDTLSRLLEPNLQQAMVAVKQAEKTLKSGITTVCDVSMAGPYLKKLIDGRVLRGPRILPCGQGLAMGGGGPYVDPTGIFPLDYIKENHPWGVPCDGADNLRHEIRNRQRIGCDAIKIWTTGGGLNDRPFDTDRIYTDEEISAISDEAGMAGMVVLTHCESIEGTKAALRNDVIRILHGAEMDDECIRLMKEKDAWLMPTFKINLDWVDYYSDEELLRRKNIFENEGDSLQEKEYNRILNNFKRAYEAGVKIALASDSYCEEETPYGEYALEEIKTFVNSADVPTAEALLAATRYAAEALQIDDRLGTLETGKIADILILNSDISKDISKLKESNIDMIIKDGEILK